MVHIDIEHLPAIAQAHPDAFDLVRQGRVEMQGVATHVDADEAALHEVDRPRHGTGMNAFRRGTALHIGDVTVERVLEVLP